MNAPDRSVQISCFHHAWSGCRCRRKIQSSYKTFTRTLTCRVDARFHDPHLNHKSIHHHHVVTWSCHVVVLFFNTSHNPTSSSMLLPFRVLNTCLLAWSCHHLSSQNPMGIKYSKFKPLPGSSSQFTIHSFSWPTQSSSSPLINIYSVFRRPASFHKWLVIVPVIHFPLPFLLSLIVQPSPITTLICPVLLQISCWTLWIPILSPTAAATERPVRKITWPLGSSFSSSAMARERWLRRRTLVSPDPLTFAVSPPLVTSNLLFSATSPNSVMPLFSFSRLLSSLRCYWWCIFSRHPILIDFHLQQRRPYPWQYDSFSPTSISLCPVLWLQSPPSTRSVCDISFLPNPILSVHIRNTAVPSPPYLR